MSIRRLVGPVELLEPFKCDDGTTYQRPGKPYIPAEIYWANGSEIGAIDFLVDTGADLTFISPLDRRQLIFPDNNLVQGCPYTMSGLGGGLSTGYLQDVVLRFQTDDDDYYSLSMDRLGILIQPEDELDRYATVPSVIGMDILSQCDIEFTGSEVILSYKEP